MSFQRTRSSKNAAVIILLMCLWSAPAGAQFETALKRYTGDNAAGYLRPLATALGNDFNRGWYHSAFVPRHDFYLRLDANAMMAFLVEYEPDSTPGERIKLDVDAENGARATLGANLKLAILNLNADYSFGAQSAFSAGFGLIF